MLHRIYVMLLACAMPSLAKAQVPLDSIYRSGTTWIEYTVSNVRPGQGSYFGYEYMITRDTQMAGNTYRLVGVRNLGGYTVQSNNNIYVAPSLSRSTIAALRTSGRKVYHVNLDTTGGQAVGAATEKLLYDFGLNPGDAIAYRTGKRTVLSADTVCQKSGQCYRRLMFLDYGPGVQDYWLDGIGSSLGLLNPEDGVGPENRHPYSNQRLLCFSAGSLTWKMTDTTEYNLMSSCWNVRQYGLSVPQPAERDDNLVVYPVPTEDGTLIIDPKGVAIDEIQVFDMMGRAILSKKANGTSSNIRLILPGSSKGTLILNIVARDGIRLSRRIEYR